jgi:hypothetical protein
MDVIIRKMDEKLHRRLKAEAAIRGMTLSSALEQAVRMWVRTEDRARGDDETESNNRAYESMKDELGRRYRNKYVVFAGGRFLGCAESLREAGNLARHNNALRVLAKRMGGTEPAGGDWLWSSLDL